MRAIKLRAMAVAVLFCSMMLLPMAMTSDAETTGERSVTCAVFYDGQRTVTEEKLSLLGAQRLLATARRAVDGWKNVEDGEVSDADRAEITAALTHLLAELKEKGLVPDDVTPKTLGLLPDGGIAWMHPIVSIGSGFGWIPLYPGEAFLGVMLRPIFLQYFLLGYTGCLNARLIPPRIEYWDFAGTQTVMVFGFAGLYLDFASLGLGIPPVQVLMGESLFTGGIDWPA